MLLFFLFKWFLILSFWIFLNFVRMRKRTILCYLVNTKLHSIVVQGTGEDFFINSATSSVRLLHFPVDVSLIDTKSHRASLLSWVLDIWSSVQGILAASRWWYAPLDSYHFHFWETSVRQRILHEALCNWETDSSYES